MPQMGAWHQDSLADWLSVKPESQYDWQLGLVSGAHLVPPTSFSVSLRFSFRQLLFVML
jgi:hypothetical protein